MRRIRTRFVRVVGPGPDAVFKGRENVDRATFFDRRFIGRVGQVVSYSTKGDLADVGDSPDDPAYLVKFGPGFGMGATEDLFWTEELRPLKLSMKRRILGLLQRILSRPSPTGEVDLVGVGIP
jgi:hypothetical protein